LEDHVWCNINQEFEHQFVIGFLVSTDSSALLCVCENGVLEHQRATSGYTTTAVMSSRARERSQKLTICKERLNRLFEELDQLCVGPAEVLEIEEQISMT
ncbi:hypothetical protein T4C_4204, partial [Trichinella pseudospiralis]